MSDDHAERCLARYFEIIGERPERFVNTPGDIYVTALQRSVAGHEQLAFNVASVTSRRAG